MAKNNNNPEKRKELYSYLKDNDMTPLSYDEFSQSYGNNDEKFYNLFNYLSKEEMTTLSPSQFKNEYFGDLKKKEEPKQKVSQSEKVSQSDGVQTREESSTSPKINTVSLDSEDLEKESDVIQPLEQSTVRRYKEWKEAIKVSESDLGAIDQKIQSELEPDTFDDIGRYYNSFARSFNAFNNSGDPAALGMDILPEDSNAYNYLNEELKEAEDILSKEYEGSKPENYYEVLRQKAIEIKKKKLEDALVEKKQRHFLRELPSDEREKLQDYTENKVIESNEKIKQTVESVNLLKQDFSESVYQYKEELEPLVKRKKEIEGMEFLDDEWSMTEDDRSSLVEEYKSLGVQIQGVLSNADSDGVSVGLSESGSLIFAPNEELAEELEKKQKDFYDTDAEIGTFVDEADLFNRSTNFFNVNLTKLGASSIEVVGGMLDFQAMYDKEILGSVTENIPVLNKVVKFRQLMNKDLGDRMNEISEDLRSGIERDYSISEADGVRDYFQFAIGTTAETTPYLLAYMANPAIGASITGTSSGGSKYRQIQTEIEEGAKYGKGQIILSSLMAGASEATLGALPTIARLKKFKRVYSSVDNGVRESAAKGFFKKVKDISGSTISEGLEEGGVQSLMNFNDSVILEKEGIGLFDGISDPIAAGGVVGFLLPFAGAVSGSATRIISNSSEKRTLSKNSKRALEIEKKLSEGNLSDESTDALKNEYIDLLSENSNVILGNADRVSKASKKEFSDLKRISKNLESYSKDAKEIKENTELDDATKKKYLNSLRDQAKSDVETVNTVLNDLSNRTKENALEIRRREDQYDKLDTEDSKDRKSFKEWAEETESKPDLSEDGEKSFNEWLDSLREEESPDKTVESTSQDSSEKKSFNDWLDSLKNEESESEKKSFDEWLDGLRDKEKRPFDEWLDSLREEESNSEKKSFDEWLDGLRDKEKRPFDEWLDSLREEESNSENKSFDEWLDGLRDKESPDKAEESTPQDSSENKPFNEWLQDVKNDADGESKPKLNKDDEKSFNDWIDGLKDEDSSNKTEESTPQDSSEKETKSKKDKDSKDDNKTDKDKSDSSSKKKSFNDWLNDRKSKKDNTSKKSKKKPKTKTGKRLDKIRDKASKLVKKYKGNVGGRFISSNSEFSRSLKVDPELLSETQLKEYEGYLDRVDSNRFNYLKEKPLTEKFASIYDDQPKRENPVSEKKEKVEHPEETIQEFHENKKLPSRKADRGNISDFNFLKSLTDEELSYLSKAELEKLIANMEVISEGGKINGNTMNAISKIKSIRNNNELSSELKEGRFRNLLRDMYFALTKTKDKKKLYQNYLRRTPLRDADNALKGEKGDVLFRASGLEALSKSIGAYTYQVKNGEGYSALDILNNKMIFNNQGIPRSKENRTRINSKLYLIHLQRQYESNPNTDKDVNSPEAYIKASMDYAKENAEDSYNEQMGIVSEMYRSLPKKSDGTIDVEKSISQLSKEEREIHDIITEFNNGKGREMSIDIASMEGKQSDMYDNYTPLFTKGSKRNLESLNTEAQNYIKGSLFFSELDSLKDRDGKAHALDFDFVDNFARNVDKTYRKYNILPAIKEFNATMNRALRNDDIPPNSKEFLKAYRNVIEKKFQDEFVSSYYADDKSWGIVSRHLSKLGYFAELASPLRTGVEVGTNLIFGVLRRPKDFTRGLKNRTGRGRKDSFEDLKYLAVTGGSGQLDRLFIESTGQFMETEAGMKKVGGRKRGVGSHYKAFNGSLIGGGDRAIALPLWEGSFHRAFERITGKGIDVERLRNDNDYYESIIEPLTQAAREADKALTEGFSSLNPLEKTPISTLSPEDRSNILKMFNVYMTSFQLAEHSSVIKAIDAIKGDRRDMSRTEGGVLMAATLTRMGLYNVGMQYGVTSLMDAIMGLFDMETPYDDEDDRGVGNVLYNESMSVLANVFVMRRLGNLSKIVASSAIETANVEFGVDLGLRKDDSYNFRDSLTFSVMPRDEDGNLILSEFEQYRTMSKLTGAYRPFIDGSMDLLSTVYKSKSSNVWETRVKNREKIDEKLLKSLMTIINIPAPRLIKRILMYEEAKKTLSKKDAMRIIKETKSFIEESQGQKLNTDLFRSKEELNELFKDKE